MPRKPSNRHRATRPPYTGDAAPVADDRPIEAQQAAVEAQAARERTRQERGDKSVKTGNLRWR